MSPSVILQIALPVIESLPSIFHSFSALFAAAKAMIEHGATEQEVVNTIAQAAPQVTAAIVANTPVANATTVAAPPAEQPVDQPAS